MRIFALLVLVGNQLFAQDIVTILQAIEEVDKSILLTDATWSVILKDQKSFWSSPQDIFLAFKRPDELAASHARSAEILNHFYNLYKTPNRLKRHVNTTDTLSPNFIASLEKLAGCKANFKLLQDCNELSVSQNEYRTITGQCNNLNHPFWGSSNQPLHRYTSELYEDGVSEPIGWNQGRLYNGFPIPNARTVSNRIFKQLNADATDDTLLSHFAVTFGQYVDHDFSFSPLTPANVEFFNGQNCKNSCDMKLPCYPIIIPENDPKFGEKVCLPFFRSAATCGTDDMPNFFSTEKTFIRKQLNTVTSLIDASLVYGNDEKVAFALRTLDGTGRLKVSERFTDNGRGLLIEEPTQPCVQSPSREANNQTINCFKTGDHRASEHLTLSAIHTIWVREHNLIAEKLALLNSHWGENEIYEETRHIIAAFHQKTTYDEYYTAITNDNLPAYSGYNSSVNPNVAASFSGAAFRFGHVTIHPMVRRFDENWNDHPDFPSDFLHKAFFSPWRIIDEGGIDPLIRGLIGNFAKLGDGMVDELREKLFKLQNSIGFDLAAINIQRGRDHGIRLYNDWLEYCGFDVVNSWEDLSEEIPNDVIRAGLEELYGFPGNIDLFVAGAVERHLPGASVGRTFKCILEKQFRDTRDGDRFWYQKVDQFTAEFFEKKVNLF